MIYYGVNNVLGKSVESVLNCLNNAAYCKKFSFQSWKVSDFSLSFNEPANSVRYFTKHYLNYNK